MPVRVSKPGKALLLGLFLVIDLGAGWDASLRPELLPFRDANAAKLSPPSGRIISTSHCLHPDVVRPDAGQVATSLCSRALSLDRQSLPTTTCLNAAQMQSSCNRVGDPAPIATITVTSPPRQASGPSYFYVSPTGNDSNSGTLNEPFLTLQKARDVASALSAMGMMDDIIIYLRGGTHRLDSPLILGPRDSGQNGHRVIYESYPGEQATVSAGRPILGWTLYDKAKNVYRACVGIGWDFRQLYVNGKHAQRARGRQNPSEFSRTPTGFLTANTSIAHWHNITDIEVVLLGKWMINRCKIASVSGGVITMSNPCWRNAQWALKWGANLPSWIENAYELLDNPGEWYLDRAVGCLYYIPRIEENISTVEVIAPFGQDMIVGTSVHDLEFNNLRFSHSNWTTPGVGDGYVGLQAGYHKVGAAGTLVRMHSPIHFAASRNIVFKGDTFTQLGSRALTFDGGSQNIEIISNRFVETAGGAVQFGQIDDAGNLNPITQNRSLVVRNNYITDISFDYPDDVAIVGIYVADMVVEHNEISVVPHMAVSIGWGWGKNRSYSRNNRVGWNYIHDFSRVFHDSAAIYSLGAQPGMLIHHNRIMDGGQGYGCLYPDEGTEFAQWTHNVCQDVREWLHIWTSSIRGNAVRENWTDTATMQNHGMYNDVSNNFVVSDGNWPPNALEVRDHAGIPREPEAGQ
jgi:hypothetical protein